VQPGDGRTADEILRDADLAMYQAKRVRRGRGAC
jgi:GGDEF domain-containing protein